MDTPPVHPDQLDMFGKAKADRDRGMRQVDQAQGGGEHDHDGQAWREYASEFVIQYLHDHAELFVDDLWDAGLEPPPSPRALGPVMLSLARAGLMRKSGEWRPSVRSRLGPKPVWLSQVHDPVGR